LRTSGEGKKKKKKKKPKKKKLEQTDPPRLGLSKFFPDGIYPEGEIQPYKDEYVCNLSMSLRCSNAMPKVTRGERRLKKSGIMNE
jgi:hypothetical protein